MTKALKRIVSGMAVCMAIGVLCGNNYVAKAAESGFITGTQDTISWSYDAESKSAVITGSGSRVSMTDTYHTFVKSDLPKEVEKVSFLDCEMQGSMDCLFYGLKNLVTVDFTGLRTQNITDMDFMFGNCNKLISVDLNGLDTRAVTGMRAMFMNCTALSSVTMDRVSTESVLNMDSMFMNCENLQNLNLTSFYTANVTNMKAMFMNCKKLKYLYLFSFQTEKLTDLSNIFYGCNALESLDISTFALSGVRSSADVFTYCSSLVTIKTPAKMGQLALELPANYASDNGQKPTRVLNASYANTMLTKKSALPPDSERFAMSGGYSFYKDAFGNITCYDSFENPVINEFRCDGKYTYYFQADGTAMRDRLTYHPDGEHVIYFDEDGHEVFSDFHTIKKTIAGDAVDDYCFFNVFGYLYVDVLTWDKAGKELLYANPYGVLERKGWFQFSQSVKWADGTACNDIAGRYGYGLSTGTLLRNTAATDWRGRSCYLQGNGVAIWN